MPGIFQIMKCIGGVCDWKLKYLVMVNTDRMVNVMTNKQLDEKRKEVIKGVLDHTKKYGFPTKKKEDKNEKK